MPSDRHCNINSNTSIYDSIDIMNNPYEESKDRV